MGNTNSAGPNGNKKEKSRGSISKEVPHEPGGISPTVQPQPTTTRGMTRSPSGADIHDKLHTQFVPVEKLAKILVKRTENEFNVTGIVSDVFIKYVFPRYPDLGARLFHYFYIQSHAKTKHLGAVAFRQQCERFLGILDDQIILESYIRMFSDPESDQCTIESVKALLRTCFQLAMAHYSEGATSCFAIEKTLDAVITSCFFQQPLTVGFVARWLEQNCPRLVPPVHRFCIHTLSTTYRSIEEGSEKNGCGLELATPILEKGLVSLGSAPLLTISVAWLLAGALPGSYSRPQSAAAAQATSSKDDTAPTSVALPSQAFLTKLLSVVPSHWTLLYDTRQHGVGANRFLHHVLGYRGPTLVMLEAKSSKDDSEMVFCVAAPTEWRETTLYAGGEDGCLIQLQPKFQLMEKGAKILYLNTSIRGYPKGLRVAVDPRNPIIAIDEQFEKLEVHSIAHKLQNIEVWGCGDQSSREVQLDIKKWQIKEAERQRTVKLSATEWIDHPDRYLLELSGRPQYNNSN